MLPIFSLTSKVLENAFEQKEKKRKKNGTPVVQMKLQDKATLPYLSITRLLPTKLFK